MKVIEKMNVTKTVNTRLNTYFVEVELDTEYYEIRIYDRKPKISLFGVPVRLDPIIKREFNLNVPVKQKIVELINLWERPIKYRKELESWDGIISDGEDPKEEEKSVEGIDETIKKKEKSEFIRFHDWEMGSKLIRVK